MDFPVEMGNFQEPLFALRVRPWHNLPLLMCQSRLINDPPGSFVRFKDLVDACSRVENRQVQAPAKQLATITDANGRRSAIARRGPRYHGPAFVHVSPSSPPVSVIF